MTTRSIAALLTLALLTGCGTHVAQPVGNALLTGSRFETLRSKTTTDPLVKKAIQDAAKKALQALDELESAKIDPARLNPALAQALANQQITEDQIRLMLLYGQLNGVFGALAGLIDTGKDDYSKNVASQLDALGKAIKKFETARKGKSDEEAFKLLADVVKQLRKGLEALAK